MAKGKSRKNFSEEEKIDITNEVFELISEGKSVKSIFDNKKPGWPGRRTFIDWVDKNEELAHKYARAKEESAESDFEKIQEIAQKTLDGDYDPQQARVAADLYKWVAGKKRPKKYGDSSQIDLTSKGEKIETPTLVIKRSSQIENNESD